MRGGERPHDQYFKSVLQHFDDISHDRTHLDVTYENAQARMRTLILMDLANKTGGLVVGTGDLSELALGWCTYNGDHMSMYAVNCSVPKTLVKHLVRYEGAKRGGDTEKVLKDILATEISPELCPRKERSDRPKNRGYRRPLRICTIFISITPSTSLRRPLKFIILQNMRLRARTTIKRCSNG
ncbi:MAG: hypothetical protein ACLRSW_14915 [Christensenellaceae bacterium]